MVERQKEFINARSQLIEKAQIIFSYLNLSPDKQFSENLSSSDFRYVNGVADAFFKNTVSKK